MRKSKKMKKTIIVICVSLGIIAQSFAQKTYIRFKKPDIAGPTTAPQLIDYFEISNFEYEVRSENAKATSGLLSFTLKENLKFPLIYQSLLQSDAPKELEVVFAAFSNHTPPQTIKILEIKYLDVIFNACRYNSDTDIGGFLELEFWVNKYAMSYSEFSSNNGQFIARHNFGWDFINNDLVTF